MHKTSQLSTSLSLFRYFTVFSSYIHKKFFTHQHYCIIVDESTGLIKDLELTVDEQFNLVTLYDKYPQYKDQIDKSKDKMDKLFLDMITRNRYISQYLKKKKKSKKKEQKKKKSSIRLVM